MTNVEKELERFAKEVIPEAQKILKKKGKNASGKLSDIGYDISVGRNSFSLSFDMEDYWEFVDRGVKGVGGKKADGTPWKRKYTRNTPFRYKRKKPPTNKLDKWIVRKGIAPREKGKFLNRKSIQYAISNSIYHTGLETTNFFTKPFEMAFRTLPDELIRAYALDIDDFLEFTTK